MADRNHGKPARLAVVLLNMGGPDRLEAVRPFLFNLFNDPAILKMPGPARWLLATLISRRRAPKARAIYAQIGGSSPILAMTEDQAKALEVALARDLDAKVFIAMRYWHPMTGQTVREVIEYGPDEVFLLPLYPQFSTATSASSLLCWHQAARRAGLRVPTKSVCCYATAPSFIETQARFVRKGLEQARKDGAPARVLFSAHGLPEKTIAAGDPYQWQVEQTASDIAAAVGERALDWAVCYQSRVGPLQWIGPSIGDEITRAGRDGRALVVAPIAFVSEHSETLVELDIQYRRAAREAGIPSYVRVPAVGADAGFIDGLAEMVLSARRDSGACSSFGNRICPVQFEQCPLNGEAGE